MKKIDIQKNIFDKYGRSEEYLSNRYPKNYFDYYIDIGTRGICNPWHINFMATKSPDTLFLGYEPDIPYYNELVECIKKQNISNVRLHKEGLGAGEKIKIPESKSDREREPHYRSRWTFANTVRLTDIFDKYNLNPNSRWGFKSDCEGGEYSLMEEASAKCVNILKHADHIAIEFHTTASRTFNNFFSIHNPLPSNFDLAEEWMHKNFSTSHTIMQTDTSGKKLRTYVIVSDKIMAEKDSLFWGDLL